MTSKKQMSGKKIGINARTFMVNEPGGAVQSAIQITNEIINQTDREVVLFGHESLVDKFPDTPVESSGFHVKSQSFGVIWERLILPTLARNHDIDLLFCPNANGPLTTQPYPIIMYIHDVNAMKGFSAGIHQLYRSLTVPRAAQISDCVITVSKFSKGEITDLIDVPGEKVRVIYNGIDDCFNSLEQKRDKIDYKYILYVGSFNPRKNINGIIESYRLFCEKYDSDHKLILIGPGNKSIFRDFEIDPVEGVITPGFVEQSELIQAYINADAFIYPSFYEGFGLPPLESLACGTPAIVSRLLEL